MSPSKFISSVTPVHSAIEILLCVTDQSLHILDPKINWALTDSQQDVSSSVALTSHMIQPKKYLVFRPHAADTLILQVRNVILELVF